jgi:transketolase
LPWPWAWRWPNATSTPSSADLVDHRTWVIAGDGCLMEGINHEAVGLAGTLGLGRLIVLWDNNRSPSTATPRFRQ